MKKKEKVSIFLYVVCILLQNLPLYIIDGKRFTFFQAYIHIKKLGVNGISENAAMYWMGNVTTLKIQIIILILFQIFCIGYLISIILKKNLYLNIFSLVLAMINMFFCQQELGAISDNTMGMILTILFVVICGSEIVFIRIIDIWEEEVKNAKENAQKDRMKKEEKRRRLYFPGNYTKFFYKMIWKNFLYGWKDYKLLLICSVVVSVLSYTGLGCYQMMSKMHREENFLMGAGLGQILMDAMIPMGICAIFLMVFMMIYYLKKWIENYSIFVTLGTREKTLYGILALEILFSFLVSYVFGMVLGSGLLFCFRKVIENALGSEATLQAVTWISNIKLLGVLTVIYIISLMASRDIVSDFHLVRASTLRIRREKMPQKGYKIVSLIGIILMIVSLMQYSQLVRHESIYLLVLFFAGVFLLIRYNGARYLHKSRGKEQYWKKLMERNHLYHKSRTTTWYLIAMIILCVCGGFAYTIKTVSAAIAEEPETLFPYEFVCISDEGDNEFFMNLQEKYDVEIIRCPMVRVTNVDRTEEPEALEPRPQGQQIGISETTFHQLKKEIDKEYVPKNLGLDKDGKEVYIVHQQDRSVKAQSVDWAYGSSKPFLHIGLPCPDYMLTSKVQSFPKRKVAGEEIGSLIGCFRQGNLENVIVFSDEYFAEAQDMWKYINIYTGDIIEEKEKRIEGITIQQGPTQLVLVKAKPTDMVAIEKQMKDFEKNHTFEASYDSEVSCWYSKRTAIADMKTEYIMKIIANSFVLLFLLMASLFVIYVKSVSELEEKKERAKFLECMGMRRKERIRILKKELYLFYWMPILVAILAIILFTSATFYARMYSLPVIKNYLTVAKWIWFGWLLIESIYIWSMERWMIWKVEGKDE